MYFRGQVRRISDGKVRQMKIEIRNLWQRFSSLQPPQLVEKLNESILGWKRYYGMVQPVEQFQELDTYIAEGLARALAQRLVQGALPRNADLYDMLKALEFLHEIPPTQRQENLQRIVRRIRAIRTGEKATEATDTPPDSAQKQRPSLPASTAPAEKPTEATEAAPVEQVVRK